MMRRALARSPVFRSNHAPATTPAGLPSPPKSRGSTLSKAVDVISMCRACLK